MNAFTKSLMVASLLSLSGLAAQAQDTSGASTSNPPVEQGKGEVKADRQELRKEMKQVKEDKMKLKKDVSSGAPQEQIASDKKELKADRKVRHETKKKLHADKANLKEEVKQ